MALLDWLIVVLFLLAVLGGGLWFARRASGSMENFFLSGRNLPWWLAGTSILATSFASDTPLHVTRVIREEGLSGTWFYWAGIFTHLLVTFCFARLWRRTGLVTDAEFIEFRYTGRSAAFLRATMAGLRGIFLGGLTLAWVTLGMVKVVGTVLELPPKALLPIINVAVPSDVAVVAVLMVLVLVYSVSSGLWGVVVTDFIEFIVALCGAILLAVIGWSQIGGAEGLREGLQSPGGGGLAKLDFFPDLSAGGMSTFALAIYLGILWWANDAIDGSGKRAQRFLACKNEAHALGSGIWNVAVQWIIRSWPWYTAALVSLVLYPEMTDHEAVYPRMMADLLPIGLKGLMVAAFLAAFMSTVDTHLNLSSAYMVNDIYKRFVAPKREDRHYVKVARITLIVLALVTGGVALLLPSILYALKLKMELIGGLGGVLVVRWFWWRVNAWCELTALVTSLVMAIGLQLSPLSGSEHFPLRMLIIVSVSTAAWVTVALMTAPEPREHLITFYRKIGPPRWGWRPIVDQAGSVPSAITANTVVQALLCAVFVFCGMFGLGCVILGNTGTGITLIVVAAVSCYALIRLAFYREE